MRDPTTAADELRRCITKYGFKDTLFNDIQIWEDGEELIFCDSKKWNIF
jgi:2,3-dihydroxybenzoate decarboxylase